MSDGLELKQESNKLQTSVYIAIGLISVLLIGGLIYWKRRPSPPEPSAVVDQHLEGAYRFGSPEYAKLITDIRMDEAQATEDHTALGGLSMNLYTVVRNFTGKTITGLEMKGTVVDSKRNPVKSRTVIVIPDRQQVLENVNTVTVHIRIEGFKDTDDRAQIKMEITGIKTE